MSDGRATTYAMYDLVQRGTFFIAPGEDVYAGMLVGENNRWGCVAMHGNLIVLCHNLRSS
jgi:GTP-binding protein